MKTKIFTFVCVLFLSFPMIVMSEPGETAVEETEEAAFTKAELEQLLAPIALYPDVLLAQILIAATYPLEVVQAQRWTQAHPELEGQEAAKVAASQEDWDASVVALTAFPEVLKRMDEDLTWTQRVGEAFLAQEAEVLETVQSLRGQAAAAGNLKSTKQITVEREGPTIIIEPADPEVIYVPYYSTRVIYGDWRWAHHPPVYWGPYPGYYYSGIGFSWGVGTYFSTSYFYSRFHWPQRHVVVVHRSYAPYYKGPRYRPNPHYVDNPRWRHDPHHRRGVKYSARAEHEVHARHHYQRPSPQRVQHTGPMRPSREWSESSREQYRQRRDATELQQRLRDTPQRQGDNQRVSSGRNLGSGETSVRTQTQRMRPTVGPRTDIMRGQPGPRERPERLQGADRPSRIDRPRIEPQVRPQVQQPQVQPQPQPQLQVRPQPQVEQQRQRQHPSISTRGEPSARGESRQSSRIRGDR